MFGRMRGSFFFFLKNIWLANECKFRRKKKKKKKKRSSPKKNLHCFQTAAQRSGRRGRRHDLWHHVGPPGDLLLRMPAQLHSLPENLRASARLLALALQLQRVPGSLPRHHALSLVGGTHFGCCVRNHATFVRNHIFFFFPSQRSLRSLILLCMQIFIFRVWLAESYAC